MRRLPLLVSGMLLLPLGFISTSAALAAETAPLPAPSVSVSVPAEPDPDDEGEGEEIPEEDILTGVFTRTPATGPAGTTLKLASKDKCVDAEGVVGPTADILLFNLGNVDELPELAKLKSLSKVAAEVEEEDPEFDLTEKAVDTAKDGSWKTTIDIPESAETGDYFFVIAGCFAEGVDPTADDAVPFLIYEPLDFTVTGAPTAPPADPKPGDPDFTG